MYSLRLHFSYKQLQILRTLAMDMYIRVCIRVHIHTYLNKMGKLCIPCMYICTNTHVYNNILLILTENMYYVIFSKH